MVGSEPTADRRAVVIEDRGTFGPALARQLAARGRPARWVPHPFAIDLDPVCWANAPLVFLDALDLSSQQEDPTRSRLASLDLLQQFAALPPGQRPKVIVYSTHMAKPEINIPLRRPGSAVAFYEVQDLMDRLDDIVLDRYPGQVAPPTPEDWAALHPGLHARSDVAGAHQAMRRRESAWRLVWDDHAAYDKAVQVWIRRNVVSLLDVEARGYGIAVEVTRKLAGLPYASR
jgi:hypothetical protein